MGQLRGKIPDRKVLGLIRRYLEAGVVLPDGTREATPQGVPQGGPLSPLLANIALDPLDPPPRRRYGEARWRMSGNSLVQRALTNAWLHECAFARGFGLSRRSVIAEPDLSRRSPALRGEGGWCGSPGWPSWVSRGDPTRPPVGYLAL
jgi:hypothetical protein